MKIEDDFLDQSVFGELQDLMLGANEIREFVWCYNPVIDFEYEITDRFQFTHHFYRSNVPTSPFVEQVRPLIEVIDPISL